MKHNFQSDFLSARAKTAITLLNATGWKEGVVNPECVSVDAVFFYVYDYQTRWVWSCSVPRDSFYAVVQQSGKIGQSAATACCGHMIAQCASSGDLDPGKENDLAIALTAYIRITRSYQLTERATRQNHFGVIRYGSTNMLRPFVMSGPPRHLIPAGQVCEAVEQVILIDANNHPEWIAVE